MNPIGMPDQKSATSNNYQQNHKHTRNHKPTDAEASKMLEAALQQMDGIILGKSIRLFETTI